MAKNTKKTGVLDKIFKGTTAKKKTTSDPVVRSAVRQAAIKGLIRDEEKKAQEEQNRRAEAIRQQQEAQQAQANRKWQDLGREASAIGHPEIAYAAKAINDTPTSEKNKTKYGENAKSKQFNEWLNGLAKQTAPKAGTDRDNGVSITATGRELRKNYEQYLKNGGGQGVLSPTVKYALAGDKNKSGWLRSPQVRNTEVGANAILRKDYAKEWINSLDYDPTDLLDRQEVLQNELAKKQERADELQGRAEEQARKKNEYRYDAGYGDLLDYTMDLDRQKELRKANGALVWDGEKIYGRPEDYDTYREELDELMYDTLHGKGSYYKRVNDLQTDEEADELERELDDLWDRKERGELNELEEILGSEERENYNRFVEQQKAGYDEQRENVLRNAREFAFINDNGIYEEEHDADTTAALREHAYNQIMPDTYESRTAGMTAEEKAELDARIDQAISQMDNPYDVDTVRYAENDTTGQYGRGNIDLNNRQIVNNPDGTISTEYSFSVGIDGKEYLLPQVVDGKIVSKEEAIQHFYDTGEYLGVFDTPEEADAYALKLHNRNDEYYHSDLAADLKGAQSEVRYLQDQLNDIQGEIKFRTEYREMMGNYATPEEVGFRPELDRGRGEIYSAAESWKKNGIEQDAQDVHSIYSFVNGGKEYIRWAKGQKNPTVTNEYKGAMMMNDREIAQYNDFYNKGQYKEAEAFLNALQPYLNRRYGEFEEVSMRETARVLPGLSSVAAQFGMAVDTIASPIREVAGWFGDKSVEDPYSHWYLGTRISDITQDEIANQLGDYGKIYLQGMNSIRNVVNGLMTKGMGLAGAPQKVASLLGFASQIYQESTYRYLKETRDYNKTRGLAALDAIMETAEEMLPYEAMLGDSSRPVLYFVKNALSEAGEELTGATVGDYVKGLITGRNSVQKRADQIYNEGGYYKDGKWIELTAGDKKRALNEADMQALREWHDQAVENTIAGAAGGGMGSAYGFIGNLANMNMTGRQIKGRTTAEGKNGLDTLMEAAKTMKEGSESRQIAESVKEGETLSNTKAGKLAMKMLEEAQNETSEKAEKIMRSVAEVLGEERQQTARREDAGMQLASPEEIRTAEQNSSRTGGKREVIYSGRFADIDDISFEKDNNGKWQMRLTVGGEQVSASQLQATSYETAQMIRQAAVNPEFYSNSYMKTLMEANDRGEVKDVAKFMQEAATVRLMGYAGINVNEAETPNISQQIRNSIWMQAAEEHGRNRAEQVKEANRMKQGKVSFNGSEYGTEAFNKQVKRLQPMVRERVDFIAGIAQRAGIAVDFTDLGESESKTYGWENKEGIGINIGGIDYSLTEGKKTGRQHNIVVTFGHEFTHWLQRNSLQGYNNLESYVMKQYAQKYGVQGLMQRINRYAMTQGLNVEDAFSEIVANSSDQVLGDENVVKHIQETDSKLFGQIKNFVRDLVSKIKSAITGMTDSASREARAMMASGANELNKLWTGAYDDALQRIAEPQQAEDAGKTRMSQAEMDDEYMQAVESGNTDQQQYYVRQAAKEAGAIANARGWPIRLYHGTKHFGFSVFDTSNTKFNIGAIFATNNNSVANGYSEFGRDRTVDSKYIPDDGTDETLIKNAKNVLGKDYKKLTKEEAERIRNNLVNGFRKLAEQEQEALNSGSDYYPPTEIENEFWNVVAALDTVVNDDEYYFYEDEEYAENYRERNPIPAYHEQWKKIREYFNENDDEYERLKREGNPYYKLLLTNYDHSDALIDLTTYKNLFNTENSFYDSKDYVYSRDDIQDSIELWKNRGNYTLYGFAGDKPLEIDAGKAHWTGIKAPIIGDGYYITDDIAKWAKANGYTSVIIRNVLDPGVVNEYADDYIFFNPNQLKSADAITYDDDGNVIPLSERFQKDNNDIRWSRAEEDAEYMKAVESGDTEAQQRMVDAAAERAGYSISAYHGTASNFNVFERKYLGGATSAKTSAIGFYFTDSKDIAEKFSRISKDPIKRAFGAPDKTARVLEAKLKINNPYIYESDTGDAFDMLSNDMFESAKEYTQNWAYPVKTKDDWKRREQGVKEVGDFFARNLKKAGYDGIIVRNTRMDGNKPHDFYIAFNSNQIKSGEPVVYDDQGKVIPLSERFNDQQKDIRYSKAEAEDIRKAEENGIALDTINHTASRFSRASYERSDYFQNPDEMARILARNVLGSESRENIAKAKKWIEDVTSISAMIAERSDVLDYYASPGRSSFKSNPEYGGSIDSSTICAKRRLQTGTLDAIQRALPDYVMTAEDFLRVRNMMKERGYEVSCGLCYVESSRKNIAKYASQFMREWNSEHPDNKVDMTQINTVLGLEETRLHNSEVYEAYEKFMNKLAQRKPKLFEMRSEYNNDIIKHFRNDAGVEEKNKNGGMRINSFSDFEIVHLIDMMQVIMDMSNVGLAGQAFTKVREFAEALGPTGLKINMSMIAKGVDENGRIIFDEIEGMKWSDVSDLRDRYADNVGTICVIFTEEQLLAAMNDDRIDFIIPFHRSQWSKSNYKDIGLPDNVKDFTYWQNERYAKPVYGTKKDGSPKKLRAANYMPNEYWDFSKSGKENAEIYLRKCFDNNKIPKFWKWLQNNGDGSFSLKEDGSTDGYWKLLIDFKMYNHLTNDGAEQMPVRPDFDMEASRRMLNEYKGGHTAFPEAEDVVNDFVKEKKNGRKGIERTSGGRISLAGAEIDSTRMSRAEDEEALDAGVWIANLTPSSVQTEDERQLIQAYKDKRISISLSLKRQIDYKSKIDQLEKKDTLTREEQVELENLQGKLKTQQDRMAQLEKEMQEITSKEGYAGMMYRYNKVLKDFVQGRTSDQIREAVDGMLEEVSKGQAEIDSLREEIKELENKPAVREIRSTMAKTGQKAEINDAISQYVDGKLTALSEKLESIIKAGYKASEWSKILQNDVHTAIDYYNKMARVAAQEEKTKVRQQLIEQLRSENARKLYEQQDKYEQLIRDNLKARELEEDNLSLRRKINTNLSRMRKRLMEETDQKNIPEETKQLARHLLGKIVSHDMTDGLRRLTFADKKQLMDVNARLAKMTAQEGAFDPERDLDWLVIRYEADESMNDYDMRDRIIADLRHIDNGLLMYWTAEGNGIASLQNRKEALDEIQKAVSEITSVIQARGQAFISGKRYEVADLAERMEDEMSRSKFKGERQGFGSKARTGVVNGIGYGNLTPEYFFKNLHNSVMTLLHNGFKAAENENGLQLAQMQKRVESIAEATGFRKWDGQEKHQVTVNGGRKVTMTTEQIMALYATWLRERNALRPEETAHLLKGGFVLAKENTTTGKPRREKNDQHPIKMTKELLNGLSDYLTINQRNFVWRIVEYMSNEIAEIGNKASMETFGIKKFTEKYYFPIKSWRGVLAQSSNAGVRSDNDNAAMRQSFTKRITAGAQNAVEISDFTPTAMKHMIGMLNYNTIGPAVENLNKILNFNLTYGDVSYGPIEEGMEVIEDNRYKRSVRAAFQNAYGKSAADYLQKFMDDINGGTGRRNDSTVFDKLLSTFRKGAVAGSLSVAAQQPLSYIRAATMINPVHLANAIAPWHWGKVHEEMTKYSGIAVIKDMGRFDMQIGMSMVDYITPETKESGLKTAWTKFSDATTILPEKMDALTWGRMWVACKLETAAKNPGMDQKSDEFLKKVAERFNDVMRKTQVYDSVMVKSQNMRSKNPAIKSITSFMAEPTLTLNVLADAVRNAGQKGGMLHLANAGALFALSGVMQALVKAIMSSGRSPDKKKTLEEQFLTRWFTNAWSEINPMSLIPGYSDLIELLKKGEVSNDALGVIGKIRTIGETAINAVSGKGNGVYRDIEDTAGQIAQIFTNVPVKNIMRDMRAMMNFFSPDTYAKRESSQAVIKYGIVDAMANADNMAGVINSYLTLAESGYGTGTADYVQRLYNAKKNGDRQGASELEEYILLGKGKKEKDLVSDLKGITKKDNTLTYKQRIASLRAQGMKDTDIASWIAGQYKDGKINKTDAVKLYMAANPAKTENEAYFYFEKAEYEKKTGTDAANSDYFRLNDAMKKNDTKAFNDAVKELTQHGKDEKEVQEYVMSSVTKDYKDGKINKAQATDQLKKWRKDLTADDIWWTLDRIDYKKETGKDAGGGMYYRLYNAIEANKSDAIKEAVKNMTAHGKKADDIKKQIGTKYKQAYLDATGQAKIRLEDALTKAYKAVGLTADEALKIIRKWKPSKKKKD